MRKYYYTCPRCGRTWVKFFPRAKMKCKFCEQEWRTKNRKGTRSRFSFTATLFWLFWLAVIVYAAWKIQGFFAPPTTERVRRPVATETEVPEEGVSENAEQPASPEESSDVHEPEQILEEASETAEEEEVPEFELPE
ncbi:MAG: hypothetical protein IJM30_02960 [Thermoguttaceae bacterium]|nr:hypothetical protein [Thermoguttaceae bacterium]